MKVPILIILFLCGIALLFSPRILNMFEPESSEKPEDTEPVPWRWTSDEIWKSLKESGCSLPHANCSWRPYHRQWLSFVISNLVITLMSTAMFYPGYLIGFILPLPTVTFNTRIRIGQFDIIDD